MWPSGTDQRFLSLTDNGEKALVFHRQNDWWPCHQAKFCLPHTRLRDKYVMKRNKSINYHHHIDSNNMESFRNRHSIYITLKRFLELEHNYLASGNAGILNGYVQNACHKIRSEIVNQRYHTRSTTNTMHNGLGSSLPKWVFTEIYYAGKRISNQ